MTAMPIEIIPLKNNRCQRVLHFDIKRLDREHVITVKNKTVHKRLSEARKSAFAAVGGRSFGRIDIKLYAAGISNFIEAYLMPGLSKGCFYRSCAINLGTTYDEMIFIIMP